MRNHDSQFLNLRNCPNSLSPECVVEPAVEEWVVAVGAHGEHVAQEEDEVVVVPAAESEWGCIT